ncbi:hypothetical protein D9615_006959 [Tricholomella constricta]|uniref:Sphingomyelin phosphodiesterase C-terminal domain-containing protein n=1 Tax=Tricholomella constricta TaxID=117010 RepID=A0A8H5H8V8_9AGAR|nr:hypothetical protein D9615_006959 [Tricholomella constricta]
MYSLFDVERNVHDWFDQLITHESKGLHPQGRAPFQVAHFSDVHIDRETAVSSSHVSSPLILISCSIMSINTVYWYKANFWLYDSDKQQPDPNGILAFTVKELQMAEDAGQRAWIVAHMPPGRQDTLQDQSNYFDQIMQHYKNTITGQFYGHSHQDQSAIAYSNYARRSAETAVSVGWIAPALTLRESNPAFRVYDVDPDTYKIMDSHVFRSNFDSPTFQINPIWELYYSARATYGPLVGVQPSEALGPAFWHRVTEAFARNDTAFQQYNTFLSSGFGVRACNAACKTLTICGLRALRAQDNCQVSKPGLNFRKRDEEGGEHVAHGGRIDDCDGGGLGSIFSQLPQRLSKSPAEREKVRKVIEESLAFAAAGL